MPHLRSHRQLGVTEGRIARTAHFMEGSGRLTRQPIPPSTPPPFRKQTASGMPSGILCVLRRVQNGHHSDSTLRIAGVCRAFRGRLRTHTMLPRRPTLSLLKYYTAGGKVNNQLGSLMFFRNFPGGVCQQDAQNHEETCNSPQGSLNGHNVIFSNVPNVRLLSYGSTGGACRPFAPDGVFSKSASSRSSGKMLLLVLLSGAVPCPVISSGAAAESRNLAAD